MADDTYRTVTPYLLVKDAERQLTFLENAFGATTDSVHRSPEGAVMHAEVTIGNSLVMLGQSGPQWPAKECALYLWMDDVDATYRRALDAGATSESEPEDKPYGHRNAGVMDPNGNTWWIAAPVQASGLAAP
jgi:uncharacterized glyoxalase superfamily protein PhnB